MINDLFQKNKNPMTYSDIDRSITGSAVPYGKVLKLSASKKMAAEFFTQRREIGIINIGDKGSILVAKIVFMNKIDKLKFVIIGTGNISGTY